MNNHILTHYLILSNSGAHKILDVDAYLEKEHLISREYGPFSIGMDIQMDTLLLTRSHLLPIYSAIYNHIYTPQEFDEDRDNVRFHYDICIINSLADFLDDDMLSALLNLLLPDSRQLIIQINDSDHLIKILNQLPFRLQLNEFPGEDHLYLLQKN